MAGVERTTLQPSRNLLVAMSEPNPYQPPQSPEPLTTTKVVKRGVGLAVILLLTPVAVIITGGISCAAGAAYLRLYDNIPTDSMLNTALAIFLIPPAFVLFGMLSWAAVRWPHRQPVRSKE